MAFGYIRDTWPHAKYHWLGYSETVKIQQSQPLHFVDGFWVDIKC